MLSTRDLKLLDFRLIFVVCLLLGVGLLFIYSATFQEGQPIHMLYKQLLFVGVGAIVFWFALNMDFRILGSMSYFFYFASLWVLVWVLVSGALHQGAKSWFDLGPFSFQPSELAKVGIIFMLARFLSEHAQKRETFKYVMIPIILTGLPMALIIKQPDLGTAMVLVPVLFGMLFTAGVRKRYLFAVIALGLIALPVGWSFLHQYQRQRLLVFLNPNMDPLGAGYNAIQSKIAIGSGGLWGKGWLEGTQSQLHFLPERHTDFIFSVLGEEWGFVGCFSVLLIYLFVILSGLRIARDSGDLFGRYLSIGLVLMLASHVVINTGMTVGVMPITGIPLPYLSYGGSHLMTVMASLGFLENVQLRK
ncbi:MAG: rod shape-determining protein RodA [Chlamydiae bacterium]|nr:rod shape-determining protein RodA [Chlamydiota bacterium]MBI3266588.1 rod shape-determining protein RodA [Chlamydiota bacterium]